MSFFDFFKKNKGSKIVSDKKIQGQIRKVREKYAKTDYRQMAMETLLSWNTPESLCGALERFCVVVDSPGSDEAEKTWLVDEMAKRGDPAKQALISFIQSSNEVAHAIVALEKMCPAEEVLPALLSALKKRPPADHRLAASKVELIAVLKNYLDKEITVNALIPHLNDHHDDVQLASLDALQDMPEAFDVITAMIADDSRSARVLRHAAKIISSGKIPVSGEKLAPEIGDDYEVVDGLLRFKKA